MKRYVIICCLFLTMSYASNTAEEINFPVENTIIFDEEIRGLSLQEFQTIPLEEL